MASGAGPLQGMKANPPRRALGMVFVALATASVLIMIWFPRSPSPEATLPTGPLQIPPTTTDYGSRSDVGQSHTYGELLLRNAGKEPATLVAASVIEEDPDLELLGILATDPRRLESLIGHAPGYPPSGLEDLLQPVEGYVVAPGEDLNLLLGLRVLNPGAHLVRGIRLEYSVDGTPYAATIPDSFQLCAPTSQYPSCEPISDDP